MSLPKKRTPVHVEFDFNDLHITGEYLSGKDHAYHIDAVIDGRGKHHKLLPHESLAILRCLEGVGRLHGANKLR